MYGNTRTVTVEGLTSDSNTCNENTVEITGLRIPAVKNTPRTIKSGKKEKKMITNALLTAENGSREVESGKN